MTTVVATQSFHFITQVDSDGAQFWPAPDKVEKWLVTLASCRITSELSPGLAAKLAGQLQWACQCTFKRQRAHLALFSVASKNFLSCQARPCTIKANNQSVSQQ